MLPIFNEYISFLKSHNINYPLKQGYLWIDNQIIKGFDKQGNVVKLIRLKIADDLSMTAKSYPKTEINYDDLESWQDTISRHCNTLREREREIAYV